MQNCRFKRPFKVWLLFLALMLCLSGVAFAAESDSPMVYAEVGAVDENGFFDLVVSAENLDFLVSEFAFRYNKDAVIPVHAENGEPTSEFIAFSSAVSYDGLQRIGQKLNSEKGYFLFTMFASPGSSGDNIRNNMMHFEEKSTLYTFRFKKIADGDMGFCIASAFDGGVYDEMFPDGAVVTSAVSKRHVTGITVKYGETEKKTESVYYYYSELYPTNFTKDERLDGTVYLVMKDYASAVDGALCAIDADNHEVTPFEENGKKYFPLRFVCESFGAEVGWNESDQTVRVAFADGRTASLDTASGLVYIDGEQIAQSPMPIVHGRTMVTEEVLCAITGARVYDVGTGTVFYTGIPEWTPERDAEKEALSAMQYVLMPFFRMFL